MRLWIRHESLYRYDLPVALGDHVLRLSPRPDAARIISHHVMVEPLPVERRDELDVFGNSVLRLKFAGTTQLFRVDSELEVETLLATAAEPHPVPMPWPGDPVDALSVYRGSTCHPSIRQFAEAALVAAGPAPIDVLNYVCQALFDRIDRHVRPTGAARPAHETLALGSGACRDLSVLFMDVARSLGLASRFVSGYQSRAQTPDGQRHLHAWAEVLVPGVGWRGWDPMHGVQIGDGHVALAAAPSQEATMPIEGAFSFQGAVVNSTLDHAVRIRTSF